MAAHKNITKIVVAAMAVAICLCLAAMAFAEPLTEAFGGASVTMEYESRLFGTDEIININIIMDEAEWDNMLSNAISETYSQCDVEINGEMFYRVGIRPKGNTSLTSIANDPETDRYSFKLEFDQYVDGQSCYGLDKLVLNNNYADATNRKEALIYDMYQYLDVDASLYNYAKISVNGEYWGVYLALEAVEESFMLRNYGTENGQLYKPEGMELGGAKPGDGDMAPPDGEDNGPSGQVPFQGQPPSLENTDNPDAAGQIQNPAPESDGENPVPGEESPAANALVPSENNGENPVPGEESPAANALVPSENNGENSVPGEESPAANALVPSENNGENPTAGKGGFGVSKGGGFSMGSNGANLNYTDDELDSYSAIWDGEVTDSGKADHRRVVAALKHISDGTSLETYMDVDNLLKYMAVHVFSVNEDSLSGRMAHNYYLYEENGRLNILPWDYNLAFGGMGGEGSNGSATSMVNDAIDNAFSGTNFFDALLENEEYQLKYYGYLKQLADEYISGGRLEGFYRRIHSQIDPLVENDPTAFYAYEEYLEAADMLYEVVELRGQSINGQIEGTIPSVSSEQVNSEALVDAAHLDLSVMGSMGMGDRMREWNGDSPSQVPEETFPEGSGMPQLDGSFSGHEGLPVTVGEGVLKYGACVLILAVAFLFVKKYQRRPYKK